MNLLEAEINKTMARMEQSQAYATLDRLATMLAEVNQGFFVPCFMFQSFVLIGLQSWMCNSELDWSLAHS